MTPADEIPGLGRNTDRPRLNTTADLRRFNLTTTEGFVLSRIDGHASYDEICHMSTLGREDTLAILRRLKRDMLILGPGDKVAPIGPHKSQPTQEESPTPYQERETPRSVAVMDEMVRRMQEKPAPTPESVPRESGSLLARLDNDEPVAPADLIDGHDLPVETKRRIIRLCHRLRALAPHELLGVPEDADKATIRRAFAAASKELHPDRHYGKDLGSFREKLAKIFSRVTEAVQELEKGQKSK